MKRQTAFFLTLLLMTVAHAQTFDATVPSGQTLRFSITGPQTVSIQSSLTHPTGHLSIPSTVTYGGTQYTVTGVNASAFNRDTTLISLSIPASVQSIGSWTFYNCTALTTVNWNANNVTVGSYAFSGDTNITTLVFGSGVTKIPNSLCSGWSHLTNLTLPETVDTIGDYAFQNCSTLTAFTIPASVRYIGRYAFWDCSALTAVTIPASVRYISSYAFLNCSALTTVNWNANNVTIVGSAFSGVTNITTLVVGSGVTKIPNSLCSGWSHLTNLTLPETVDTIGDFAFSGCKALSAVTVPASVRYIGSYAFQNCSALTTINWNANNAPISNNWGNSTTFSGDTNITTINIGSNVTTLPQDLTNIVRQQFNVATGNTYFSSAQGVLYNANFSRLVCAPRGIQGAFTLPETVDTIGDNAFQNCTALTAVTIPASVRYIGSGAFQNCSALTTVNYNANNASISRDSWGNSTTFSGDTNITTLVVGSGVTKIPNSLCSGWSHLTNLTLPETVDTIENYAFRNCTALTAVTIPASVRYIFGGAFQNCTALTTVNYNANNASVESTAFEGDTSITTINIGSNVTTLPQVLTSICRQQFNVAVGNTYYSSAQGVLYNANFSRLICTPKGIQGAFTLPETVDTIGDNAFQNCSALTAVTIPASVRYIGSGTFQNCSALTAVTIPASVRYIGSGAFRDCSALTTINYNANNATIGGSAFWGDTNITTLVVGSGVTKIPNSLCSGWSHLSNITLPETVDTIGNYAFQNCSALTSVTIPASIRYIGYDAFTNCTNLTTINYNASNANVRGDAFPGDTNIATINIGSNVTTLPQVLTSICRQQFNVAAGNTYYSSIQGVLYNARQNNLIRCPLYKRGNVTIGTNVNTIQNNAFANCTFIDTLTLNARNLSQVGTNIFNLSNVHVLMVGEEVGALDNQFIHIPGLVAIHVDPDNWTYQSTDGVLTNPAGTHIVRCPRGRPGNYTVPNTITHIDAQAFQNCTALTAVDLNHVTNIGQQAFAGCTGLQTVTIPSQVDTIGNGAFQGNHLQSATYNAINVKACGTSIFTSDSLRTAVVGNGVKRIVGLFADCHNLSNVTLPSTLEEIGNNTFSNCTALASVSIPTGVRTIGINAFRGISLPTELTLPDSLRIIEESAFNGWSGISTLTIPHAVKSIGESAFDNCTNLSTVLYLADSAGCGRWTATRSLVRGSYVYLSNTNIDRLTVGEGVRHIDVELYRYNVDSLILPTTLRTVTGNSGSEFLTYVEFNCAELFAKYQYSDEANSGMFEGCTQLRHVIFGDSVGRIPRYAFKGCINVREFVHLNLPHSVHFIGTNAFEGCNQMLDAVIHEEVDTIGLSPFYHCRSLHTIHYNARHSADAEDFVMPKFRSYSAGALDYNNVASSSRNNSVSVREMLPPVTTFNIGPEVEEITSCIVGYPFSKIIDTLPNTTVTLVNNQSTRLRRIGKGAFANTILPHFDFGDSLRTIGAGAFINCDSLRSVLLPEGCEAIEDAAFLMCMKLDSVSLPSTLKAIGTDCFARDSALSYLYFDCDSAYTLPTEYGNINYCTPFSHTVNLSTIHFGPHVRYLNDALFYNAEGLTCVEIPEGVQGMSYFTFGMNTPAPPTTEEEEDEEERVSFPGQSVVIMPTNGGYYASSVSTTRLRKVVLPSSLWYLEENVFVGCHYLDTIVFRSTNPPSVGRNSLLSNQASATLIVPCGSAETYRNHRDTTWSNMYGHWSYYAPYEQGNIIETIPYNVTVTSNDTTLGTTSMACSGNSRNGLVGLRITATTKSGNHFVRWSDGNTQTVRTIYLNSDTNLQAIFAWGEIYWVHVLSTSNARGTATGTGNFVQGEVDTLTATANYGYHFSMWSDSITTNPRVITVTGNTTLQALFEPNTYTISVAATQPQQGSVSGGGAYTYNTNATLTATPATGYHFAGWNDGNLQNPRTLRVLRDSSFTASFALNSYTVTLTCDTTRGSVAGNGTFLHGDTATLTATPTAHYHFVMWSDSNTANPRSLVVSANTTLTALFEGNTFTVTATCDTLQGTVTGSGTFLYGDTTLLTALPATGYHFSMWSDSSTANPRPFVVTDNTTLTALFALNSYTVTLTCDSTRGSVAGSGTFLYGDTATLTAIPATHYQFVRWSDYITDNPRTLVVTEDLQLEAVMERISYRVNYEVKPGVNMGHINFTTDPDNVNLLLYNHFYSGATLVFDAIAETGYTFAYWTVDGDTLFDHELTVVVEGPLDVTAYFDTLYYNIAVGCDTTRGSVSTHGGTYAYGSSLELTATPREGYRFRYWLANGEERAENPLTYRVTGNDSVVAIFEDEGSVGIDPTAAEPQASVYPNPTVGQVVLTCTDADQAILYDLHGRLLQHCSMKEGRGTFDLSTLPAGTYTVDFRHHGRSVARQRIVKR